MAHKTVKEKEDHTYKVLPLEPNVEDQLKKHHAHMDAAYVDPCKCMQALTARNNYAVKTSRCKIPIAFTSNNYIRAM